MQMYSLNRRLNTTNVTVNSLHPGIVETEITRSFTDLMLWKVFLGASKLLRMFNLCSYILRKIKLYCTQYMAIPYICPYYTSVTFFCTYMIWFLKQIPTTVSKILNILCLNNLNWFNIDLIEGIESSFLPFWLISMARLEKIQKYLKNVRVDFGLVPLKFYRIWLHICCRRISFWFKFREVYFNQIGKYIFEMKYITKLKCHKLP